MAQLKGTRMTDSTLVSSVDDDMKEFEQAIASILGIPLNTEISASVLGTVLATGECRGIIKTEGAGGGAESGGGVQFKDTSASPERIFRIIATGGELELYEYDTDDYEDGWEPISTLSTPVISVEQLSEYAGLDLKDHDQKVLKIDASDPENVIFEPISVNAAGGVAFTDLSDVISTFAADSDDGDIVKIVKTGENIELQPIAPTVVGSDIQVLGDLDDVTPAAIVQPDDSGKIFGVNWDGSTAEAEWQRHIVGRAIFSQDVSVQTTDPVAGAGAPFRITSVPTSGTWTRMKWNEVGFGLPESGGLGQTDIAVVGEDYMTLPEPGPYMIKVDITWKYWYQNPAQGPEALDSPTFVRFRIASVTGSSLGLIKSDDHMLPIYRNYTETYPELGGDSIYLVAYKSPPNGDVYSSDFGFWYAIDDACTIALELQQNSGQDRYVKYATVYVAKVR